MSLISEPVILMTCQSKLHVAIQAFALDVIAPLKYEPLRWLGTKNTTFFEHTPFLEMKTWLFFSFL